jgi:hypothetical protein
MAVLPADPEVASFHVKHHQFVGLSHHELVLESEYYENKIFYE